ncbi:MAG: RecQ family ATP-dependent DNA helicase [Bacteroidales bacterium]|nr:RecQ family ATP-dependent DNA helicase [Bacteroidales bacterium]MDT8372349.1 RecQ family ATP-dependent DNA helicase [Bacteroidales bacterium]
MIPVAFVDTEIDPKSLKIIDIGSIRGDGGTFHKGSVTEFISFLAGTKFVCGHNILKHDIKYIGKTLAEAGIESSNIIDTLFLSPLLFPSKPYHALLKDDKLQSDDTNNPLNDSIKARDLFYNEVTHFKQTNETLKQIFCLLLNNKPEFQAFFRFIGYKSAETDPEKLIRRKFETEMCEQADLAGVIETQPVALAYCLSLIDSFIRHPEKRSVTPPWVMKNYPEVEQIMFRLRNRPCLSGCTYCNNALDVHRGLKRYFGFDSYKTFGGEPLQEKAVRAALDNKSLLAVFPTGGGKSLAFQVPALMSGDNAQGLTVVISPLQSLMKDQVDNLDKAGITRAVTINGLLDPIERAKSFERVEDGSASLLYIAPESLRSRTIERLLLGRKIVRFVVDEAHCLSAWGQDFRVDYLYIADFIRSIQEKKNLTEEIPVSCFTATAKPQVIDDIRNYFSEKLSLDLVVFESKVSRTNLQYKVFEKGNEEEKYQALRALIEERNCPAIIYVSRTRKAYQLAERLTKDGLNSKPYHGRMDVNEKTANQEAFISGDVSVMVATSAFGMGVDKKDVGMVVHYEISDSLENYIQEAGRAGRDENIVADCFVLYNEEDLNKHFILLNQTKLSIKEIQQVWKAIKEITRFRSSVSNSALEIARKAGWDDSVYEIETRVKTAIAALEDAGYLKRGQNMPRIFANSILSRNAQEAIEKIYASSRFNERQKQQAVRIIRKLFSSKSRKHATGEAAESRIDYISDHLGIVKEEVINIVNLLREEKILADAKDLTAFIRRGEYRNRSLNIVESFSKIEQCLVQAIDEQEKTFQLKELNEAAEAQGCDGSNVSRIKTVINFWAIKNWIKRKNLEFSKNHVSIVSLHPREMLIERVRKRSDLARFVVEFLYEKSNRDLSEEDVGKEEVLAEFSVLELKTEYGRQQGLFQTEVSLEEIEDTLFWLSRIDAIKIEGGFLVVYNSLTVERLEQDNRKRYTVEDYHSLNRFYENKVQQIHIVGEYARKMLSDYRDALQFVEDYFRLNYPSFLHKYFRGRQDDMARSLTPAKFRQLFGELSPAQLNIIKDNVAQNIVVAAGPGSGKTRLLVHKLASLLLMEDVKHEQLLMLTFSRAAATEFKKRLISLVGNAANFIEIKTFHSYCFDLLGKVGNLEKSDDILKKTVEKIKNKEVEASRITKTVLVIDEAQDMDEDEFSLIAALIEHNEEMRVIAVGDDDQNIFEFRGSSSRFLEQFIRVHQAARYELIDNFRSKSNLVAFTNQFVTGISHRLKSTPIVARQPDNGKIKLVRHDNGNLIVPFVQDLLETELSGTTCALTRTNDEALQITGLLLRNGMPAKLIQSNDGFNLFNLDEIRYFLSQQGIAGNIVNITDEAWENAKRALAERCRRSTKYELCRNLIRDFETANPKMKYKSDLEIFIRESKLEDFYGENGETILVSTIHKAKGKEFDNVFLMLEDFNPATDEAKRLLYVAMTRAKRNLTIHLNSDLLDTLSAGNMEKVLNREIHSPAAEVAMQPGFRDVWLDYFINRQHLVNKLTGGDSLIANGEECLNSEGQSVLKYSQQLKKQLSELKDKGYDLKSAKVNFIVHWTKEETGQEAKIILPELFFERNR